jgi:phosphoserine phosphatase RsbU/P
MGPLRIGRSGTACDYVFDHPAVSRMHLTVRRDGAKIFAADNNTRNGTFVNGERLTGEHELAHGDLIVICGVVLEFHADEQTDHEAG